MPGELLAEEERASAREGKPLTFAELHEATERKNAARPLEGPRRVPWTLELLPENVAPFRVFEFCVHATTTAMVGGMGGVAALPRYEGIPATEIRAALELMLVPRKRWPRVSRRVRLMADVYAIEKNAQTTKGTKTWKRT